MKLYITRHGETDWNKQMIIQGTTDNPLNQRGVEQAQEIKKFFANKELDLVIASSLERARMTASLATGNNPDIIDDRFIERNFGYFEGKAIELFHSTEDASRYDDFETDEQIIKRVKAGVVDYCNADYQQVAIFAHSHVLKAMLIALEPDNYTFSSKIKNCAVLELEYKNNQIQIIDIH